FGSNKHRLSWKIRSPTIHRRTDGDAPMTDGHLSANDLKQAICALTKVEKTNQGFELALPQVYHSGHAVVVVVTQQQGRIFVHDNGYAAMLLSNAGLRVTDRTEDALRPFVKHYGCELV